MQIHSSLILHHRDVTALKFTEQMDQWINSFINPSVSKHRSLDWLSVTVCPVITVWLMVSGASRLLSNPTSVTRQQEVFKRACTAQSHPLSLRQKTCTLSQDKEFTQLPYIFTIWLSVSGWTRWLDSFSFLGFFTCLRWTRLWMENQQSSIY